MVIERVVLLDVVALLYDLPHANLARGQVGTVVEELDSGNVLVEFADREGVVYAATEVPIGKLLKLRYQG